MAVDPVRAEFRLLIALSGDPHRDLLTRRQFAALCTLLAYAGGRHDR